MTGKNMFALLALLYLGTTSAATIVSESEIIGTYELLLCKSECSFENPAAAFTRGTVVLFKDPLSQEEVEKLDRFHRAQAEEVVRACFSGVRPEHAETYAFIQKAGATTWSFENDVLKFGLFRSPDAGYQAELRLRDGVLSGEGHSWGAGAGAPTFSPVDVIVGRRVGPPNISACSPAT